MKYVETNPLLKNLELPEMKTQNKGTKEKKNDKKKHLTIATKEKKELCIIHPYFIGSSKTTSTATLYVDL